MKQSVGIFLWHRAGEHVLHFGKHASLWGRLFSILWWVPKVFPKSSDYDLLRESAMNYYHCIKVMRSTPHYLSSSVSANQTNTLSYLQRLVDDEYATFDSTFERHFLDKYFQQMHSNEDNPKSTFVCKTSSIRVFLCSMLFKWRELHSNFSDYLVHRRTHATSCGGLLFADIRGQFDFAAIFAATLPLAAGDFALLPSGNRCSGWP